MQFGRLRERDPAGPCGWSVVNLTPTSICPPPAGIDDRLSISGTHVGSSVVLLAYYLLIIKLS